MGDAGRPPPLWNPWFTAAVVAAALAVLALPLYQISQLGYLAYMNGVDEGSYLQYDFGEVALAHYWRPGQWLVRWCHEWGLSGGQINLLFDAVSLIIIPLVMRAVLVAARISPATAEMVTFGGIYLPALFGGMNSLVSDMWRWHVESGAVSWITMPRTEWLPITRTPEPQVSFLLCAIGAALALRFRSYLPAFLIAPPLYSFVAVPWVFGVLTLYLSQRRRLKLMTSCAMAALITGTALAVYFEYLVPTETRVMLVESRAPLLSCTGLLVLLCARLMGRGRELPNAYVYVAAIALLFASSQQVLSGWIAQPHNYEQYVGITVLGGVAGLVLAGSALAWAKRAAFLIVVSIVAVYTARFNVAIGANDLTPFERDALRADAARVVTPSPYLAVVMNLVHPRQGATIFSPSRAYLEQGRANFREYACARETVRAREGPRSRFERIFQFLNAAYQHENNDYILTTLLRRSPPPAVVDPEVVPTNCPDLDLVYVDPSK